MIKVLTFYLFEWTKLTHWTHVVECEYLLNNIFPESDRKSISII